jgi:hypothetical protein
MIEYSIEELKYFYYNYDDNNNKDPDNNTEDIKRDEIDVLNERKKINHLEEALSNIIDYDYTHNHIYHIFPFVACTFIASLIISNFIG